MKCEAAGLRKTAGANGYSLRINQGSHYFRIVLLTYPAVTKTLDVSMPNASSTFWSNLVMDLTFSYL